MIFFTENDIDQLIEDDVPMGDMTTNLLNLSGQKASIALYARGQMTICCTEEAVRMYQKAGLEIQFSVTSGTQLNENDKILEASGDAASVHLIWRTGGALIEYASGVATRTRQLVEAAKGAVPVAGTRKHPPYLKKVALKALMAGGGVPHRTGLSDTILIFREHLLFTGGYENLPALVKQTKAKQKERKIVVEAHTVDEALLVAQSGAEVIQVDKMPTDEFHSCVKTCKAANPSVSVIAAGGVNASNAKAYADAGADVLVTSWMYYAPPADVRVSISPA